MELLKHINKKEGGKWNFQTTSIKKRGKVELSNQIDCKEGGKWNFQNTSIKKREENGTFKPHH